MSKVRLCVVTATAGRPTDIAEQAKRALEQLTPTERMVVVVDGGEQPTLPTDDRLFVANLASSMGVNRAYRIANSFVPAGSVVVKVDDHDWLAEGALEHIRETFSEPAVQFAYGDFVQVDPRRTVHNGEAGQKTKYVTGLFRRHCAARGLAVYRSWLYQAAGGWPDGNGCYPAGDMIMWMRMEEVLRRGEMLSGGIVHIPHVLNEVVASVLSISGQMGQAQADNAARAAMDIASHDWQPAMEVAHTTVKKAAKAPRKAETPNTPKKATPASPAASNASPRPISSPCRAKPLCYIIHSMWGSAKGGGGGEKSSAHWKPALEAAGFDVRVRATDGIGDDVEGDVRMANGVEIAAELRSELPDLVVMRDGMHGAKALVGIEPLVPLCRDLGIPAIVRMQFWRGLFDFRDERTWDIVNGGDRTEDRMLADERGCSALWRANGIIVNSQWCKDVVDRFLEDNRAEVEHPVIPAARIAVKPEERAPRYIVLPSGQLLKGLDIFLDLADKFPAEEFLVLDLRGKSKAFFDERIASQPNVEVRDWVPDMREVYREAKVVFVGTKTAETFCRAAAEARANGIPLLVSNAGNLPSFVADGGGVVVHRHGTLAQWEDGLRTVLKAGLQLPDASWCADTVATLPGMAQGLTAGRNVTLVYPHGAAGVSNGVRHLCGVTGARRIELRAIGESFDPNVFDGVILCGGVLGGYEEIIKESEAPVALNWRSHMTQMAFHPHEQEQFRQAVELVRECPNAVLMASHKDTALAWAEAFDLQTAWLPDAYDIGLTLPEWERPERRDVFTIAMLGPSCARKNLGTAFLAAKLAGAHVAASEWLRRDTELAKLAEGLGLEVDWVSLESETDVYSLVASCHAMVVASVAEAYCYAAMHAMTAGVPVIAGNLVPSCCPPAHELLDVKVTEPTQIAAALRALQQEEVWDEVADACHAHARQVMQRYNAAARDTLRKFTEGGLT